jgi:uncharacterized protein involved in response to NO
MNPPPLLALGFRVFFLLGTAYAALAMAVWGLTLRGSLTPPLAGLDGVSWHAHEMIYGVALAVIAGFLLTAVRNWTQRPTLQGWPLGGLAVLWLVPRALLGLGTAIALPWAALCDMSFALVLLAVLARPVVAARQARQAGVLAIVGLLVVGQALFYAGALGGLPDGVRWGNITGLYLIIALVLTMAARVVVFFTRSVLPEMVPPAERPWLDRAALVAFLALFVVDTSSDLPALRSALAASLAVLHARRLRSWWTPAIVHHPLLWVLHLGYGCLVVGFLLHAATPWLGGARPLALHAYAVGGVGLMMLGMVARVSLGHTGRDLRLSRPALAPMFLLGLLAVSLRVAVPWLVPQHTAIAWQGAAAAWTLAFGLLFAWALPIWLRARPDGTPG